MLLISIYLALIDLCDHSLIRLSLHAHPTGGLGDHGLDRNHHWPFLQILEIFLELGWAWIPWFQRSWIIFCQLILRAFITESVNQILNLTAQTFAFIWTWLTIPWLAASSAIYLLLYLSLTRSTPNEPARFVHYLGAHGKMTLPRLPTKVLFTDRAEYLLWIGLRMLQHYRGWLTSEVNDTAAACLRGGSAALSFI